MERVSCEKRLIPNEPTAELINACGKRSYENTSPTEKPNRSHPPPGSRRSFFAFLRFPRPVRARLRQFDNRHSTIDNPLRAFVPTSLRPFVPPTQCHLVTLAEKTVLAKRTHLTPLLYRLKSRRRTARPRGNRSIPVAGLFVRSLPTSGGIQGGMRDGESTPPSEAHAPARGPGPSLALRVRIETPDTT